MLPRVAEAYRPMYRAMVRRIVLVSLLPLLVIATAGFLAFYRLNRQITLEHHASMLRYHRESIESFLNNLTAELSTLAHQYSRQELESGDLERLFRVIQQQGGVFTDIGIIDDQGNHLKYLGPYDLSRKNYRHTDWFAQVVKEGVHISDMFLGFRELPHFIIAVKRQEGGSFWILRATVSTDYFSNLVDAGRIGKTGETFVVNSRGLNQSRTRLAGGLLEPSHFPFLTPHPDVRVYELATNGKPYFYSTMWLSNPRWMLIFRQERAEVFQPLRQAMGWGILALVGGILGATALAITAARKQVRLIARADAEKETLHFELLAAGKMAAVGEMSAGIAHEINNPLATIDTLQTWISDLAARSPIPEGDRLEILDSTAKISQQVQRCKTITQGLLKFSRRVDSRPQPIDLDHMVEELVAISRPRARLENVAVEFSPGALPPLTATPGHLQQILVNLMNNAIDATAGRPEGRVHVRTRREGNDALVEVSDNGTGIPREDLSRIFLPFFTTKPVGKGTGLGLSITYGLVQELGGTISVETGEETTFTVRLPISGAQPARSGGNR